MRQLQEQQVVEIEEFERFWTNSENDLLTDHNNYLAYLQDEHERQLLEL